MLFVCVYWCLWFTGTFSFYVPKMKHYPNTGFAGYPSFLTPFIEEEKFKEGRKNCTVSPAIANLSSYAGFFTVRSTLAYRTHLFFWYFPTELKFKMYARLVLMLQGGTGVSSMLGVFEGIGPYYIDPIDDSIKLRENRLTRIASVLYIDNPVGSGYSFSEDEVGHSFNKIEASQLLFNAIRQFFLLFSAMSWTEFFIYGESYASNYVPVLAQKIRWYNRSPRFGKKAIYLKGIMLGSMFLDPINMTSHYSSTLNQLGLIDSETKTVFQRMESKICLLAEQNEFGLAYRCFDEMINGAITPYKTLFQNTTGFVSSFNYRISYGDTDEKYHDAVAKLIQSNKFRQAINVGNHTFNINYVKVTNYMSNDIMKSVQVVLQYVLKYGFRVLIYHGQFDALIPHATVTNFVKHLNWSGSQQCESRRRWFVIDRKPVGYFKINGNLVELLMLDAGHLTSKEQPLVALELTRQFISNKLY